MYHTAHLISRFLLKTIKANSSQKRLLAHRLWRPPTSHNQGQHHYRQAHEGEPAKRKARHVITLKKEGQVDMVHWNSGQGFDIVGDIQMWTIWWYRSRAARACIAGGHPWWKCCQDMGGQPGRPKACAFPHVLDRITELAATVATLLLTKCAAFVRADAHRSHWFDGTHTTKHFHAGCVEQELGLLANDALHSSLPILGCKLRNDWLRPKIFASTSDRVSCSYTPQ